MNKTYLFYDLETSGLNKAFDQVLQFAAIRTDLNFKELERYNIIIKLREDVIPSPGAMITHRIPVSKTLNGVSEYDAVRKIHSLLNQSGTISLGYNTLGFDDEFLRFSFYRNLLNPYSHQYANDCRRTDLLPITTAFRLFRNEIISWPELNGKPTMKLEHISSLNKLAEGPAHDALVDVEATVALAKVLANDSEMWYYLDGFFDKNLEKERYQKLPTEIKSKYGNHKIGIMVNVKFGTANMYCAPVLSLGHSNEYTNQMLWIRLDTEELSTITKESIYEKSYVIRKTGAGPELVLPLVDKTNRYIDPVRKELVEKNLKWLKENGLLFSEIVKCHKEFKYEEFPELDIDSALYARGFFSREEESFNMQFHKANAATKVLLLNKAPNKDLKILARRILFRNYPELIQGELSTEFDKHMNSINPVVGSKSVIDFKGSEKTTPAQAFDEIKELRNKSLDDEQYQLLDELETYLKDKFAENKTQLDLF